MPIYTFERIQVVRMPIAECWQFFSDPKNLEKITPPSLGFKIKSKVPSEIHPGLMISYRVSPLFGWPMSWLTEITHVDAPRYFVDEQRRGPYRLWHHEHFFRVIDSEQTEVRDLMHYIPPFGWLGTVLNALVLRRQLARIFDFREKQLTIMEN